MSWSTCCQPQPWWNAWHWFLYFAGWPINHINGCGNYLCATSGYPIRGSMIPFLDVPRRVGIALKWRREGYWPGQEDHHDE